jgi:hypothetical protein
MFIERTDAGDSQEIFQLINKSLLIIAGKTDCWGCHWVVLSRGRKIKMLA